MPRQILLLALVFAVGLSVGWVIRDETAAPAVTVVQPPPPLQAVRVEAPPPPGPVAGSPAGTVATHGE